MKTELDRFFEDTMRRRGLRKMEVARRMGVDNAALHHRMTRLRRSIGSLKTLTMIAWACEMDEYEKQDFFMLADRLAMEEFGVGGRDPRIDYEDDNDG